MVCRSLFVADPALSPSCPLGKAEKFSGRREHGTPDHAILPALAGRPSVQLPAGIERRAWFIAGFRAKARPGYPQMKVERSSLHRRKRDIARAVLSRLDWPQLTSKKYLPCM